MGVCPLPPAFCPPTQDTPLLPLRASVFFTAATASPPVCSRLPCISWFLANAPQPAWPTLSAIFSAMAWQVSLERSKSIRPCITPLLSNS
ncbi:hypothetical protein D3C78_1648200 [compost metagenome]